MLQRFSNGFELQESNTELEQKIFSEVDSNPIMDIFNLDSAKIQKVKSENKKKFLITSEEKLFTNSDDDYDKDEKEEEEDDLVNPFVE